MATKKDDSWILDQACELLNKKLKANIVESEYKIKPKGATLYIVNRVYTKNTSKK